MTVSRGRSAVPSPGRLGLLQPEARDLLESLGWTGVGSIDVLWSLSRAPDADLALGALVRLREADPEAWPELDGLLRSDKRFRGRLLSVLGGSDALGDHLVAQPRTWRVLLEDRLPDEVEVREALLDAVDAVPEPTAVGHGDLLYRSKLIGADAVVALQRAYRDQLLVLAAHDLAATVENEPVLYLPEVGGRLSSLADAALTAALAVAIATVLGEAGSDAMKPLEIELAVIAMGKCGARELNYVSDVDIVFVAEPADSTSARIAGEMMRVGSIAFFDVDAALRPEGKSGALTRTLESHVAYYRRWAKTWEFQALLKARAMTGSMALGAKYIEATSSMVWDASERDDFVVEVQAMRRRVESLVPPEEKSRNVKLGRGGLRDVEFAVQLLQMVHGRVDASLHVQSTVDALAALTDGGYIGRDDGANLAASYQFLRLLEHRLQLQRLQRTHLLPDPDDTAAMRWLARAAHVRPEGTKDAVEVLRRELRKQRTRVRQLHEKLFYRPLLESVSRLDKGALRLSDESAKRQLSVLGWSFPDRALAHIRALGSETGRSGQIQMLILPGLLEHISDTPDPDAGLLNYRRLCDEMVGVVWFLRLLRDDGVVAERLMHVLGTSEYIADLLMRSPDVIQLYSSGATGPKLTEVDSVDVVKGLVASTMRASDLDRAIAVARSHRRAELARIASADLLGLMSVQEVCRALSTVWAAVLGAALDKVIASSLSAGTEAPARIAVIGMGRLGGGELGYGSDADVLFVCDPNDGEDESEALKWSQTVADRVRKMLGTPSADPPLEVDVGLRPEGKNGPIVRTLASYEAYYRQWAQAWEVQALLRAHAVAGDADLGLEFLHMIDVTRYPEGGVSSEAVREIRRIKARIDAERLPRGADPATHTKLGRGGLADVEWTVQLTQLRYAHEYPALHNTSTLETLEAIRELELLTEEQVEKLTDAWLTATKARNALVLVRGKPVDQLPGPGSALRSVAYAAGWPQDEAQEFLEHYMRVTRRAKAVVTEVFGG
ncbi:bifunctional [glutamine synthetase] adenylyltransferase/[glutamine synthetase]-adenylyl-L-tyrosine phosphorylase [Gordonia sp. (in: high G+C Gram-positive bacteria)]|uniref:bifunctional [glutamine synthetase] adenylyltransferase/[glutamine synthetase]-adenylyl-L-tyrosine phosphorylase n=1 Tax=Gordonia sp. (in: high G+C Gram-positive bacteria) TaxID=84139 RepID=UPI00169B3A2C|nr:bifunctional [glutamine synthetase] adenylyltransferase/[glutamine synthetase]-adenylyl-L-tyrosine phosphorylase [Gordonia sp. (in: high G+C Gram-positive bacteria)]NLG46919.1 bifunctional [glutamine synthetase] adenylyltransferase/[glutamine synthetase]-adenylyl-L-tyrosine phosphorylase [Gordonia sp. (in: high G+C Gram-positive bacteria)]